MPRLGLGLDIPARPFSWSRYWGAQALFFSDTFDFESNVLTDKSGNGNDVPLVGGNCVEFTNDTTITLSTAQVGASISELNNSSADTAGVSVNGSGHIEFDVSAMTSTKVYQFKLDTGDEFFLTGGTNNYVFCKPTLHGTIGGTEDTDWAWSTTNDFFGNLQYGYSKEGLLFNYAPTDMSTWPSYYFLYQFSQTDGVARYIGIDGTTDNASFRWEDARITVGKTYQIKITVSNSTEDFATNDLQIIYLNNSQVWATDDDGEQLFMNGEHIITIPCNYLSRVDFRMSDTGDDYDGKTLDVYVDYIKEYDTDILISAHNTTDAAGNTLTNPASTTQHNGCEVQLDFSGISGVTGADGASYTPPADYSFGNTLTNPMFKRVKYGNTNFNQLEGEYIVLPAFINGSRLASMLNGIEEDNMLIKEVSENKVLIIKKYDTSYDQIFQFSKVGYNEAISFVGVALNANTKPLPIVCELADMPDQYLGPFTTDQIGGPYSISGLDWVGGGHTAPNDESVQSDWEGITAFDDDADTITIADTTEFPDAPEDMKQCLAVKNYSVDHYINGERVSYINSAGVLSLTPLLDTSTADLSGVVTGGGNPSYAAYIYKTSRPGDISVDVSGISSWVACKSVTLTIVNSLIDYTTVNKNTLEGTEIIAETIQHMVSQKSDNIFINYQSEFNDDKTVQTYYGLQGARFAAEHEDTPKMYFAHADVQTLRDEAETTSGDRSTYPCEKIIRMADSATPSTRKNIANWMNLDYGTPSQDKSTSDYWSTVGSKDYFRNINSQSYGVGDTVTWKGGINCFKNLNDTYGVFAYWQHEGGLLYFIVDFTDSLTFSPSVNEVITEIAGRRCDVDYKDDVITIADSPGNSFTIPDTGLDLTATGSGNIKLRIY